MSQTFPSVVGFNNSSTATTFSNPNNNVNTLSNFPLLNTTSGMMTQQVTSNNSSLLSSLTNNNNYSNNASSGTVSTGVITIPAPSPMQTDDINSNNNNQRSLINNSPTNSFLKQSNNSNFNAFGNLTIRNNFTSNNSFNVVIPPPIILGKETSNLSTSTSTNNEPKSLNESGKILQVNTLFSPPIASITHNYQTQTHNLSVNHEANSPTTNAALVLSNSQESPQERWNVKEFNKREFYNLLNTYEIKKAREYMLQYFSKGKKSVLEKEDISDEENKKNEDLKNILFCLDQFEFLFYVYTGRKANALGVLTSAIKKGLFKKGLFCDCMNSIEGEKFINNSNMLFGDNQEISSLTDKINELKLETETFFKKYNIEDVNYDPLNDVPKSLEEIMNVEEKQDNDCVMSVTPVSTLTDNVSSDDDCFILSEIEEEVPSLRYYNNCYQNYIPEHYYSSLSPSSPSNKETKSQDECNSNHKCSSHRTYNSDSPSVNNNKKKKKKKTVSSSNSDKTGSSSDSQEDGDYFPSTTGGIKKNKVKKKRRSNAKRACYHCRRSHLRCNNERPCSRCVARGLECYDIE
ncbi:hypothetical protein ABK040_007486 [Willaertia magna]